VAENGTAPATDGAAGSKHTPRRGILGAVRDLTLASIGILGILGDEAGALYERSIERGHDDVRRIQERLRLPRPGQDGSGRPAARRSKAPEPAAEEWRATLVRLNLPTATEVHVLTQQVAELEAQIERLTQERNV
jgi:hypothetical protein